MLNNRPALLFSVPFIAGILVGWRWDVPHGYALVAASVLAVLCAVFVLGGWEKTQHALPSLLFLLIFVAGIFKITLDKDPPEKRVLNQVLAFPQPLTVKGVVADPAKQQGNRIRFVIDANAVVHQGREFPLSTSILVTVDSASREFADALQYGTLIQFVGEVTYPGTARNPGEFDLRDYLHLQGIYARAFIENPQSVYIEGVSGNWFYRKVVYPLRRSIAHNLDRYVGGEEARFLKGLTIGDRSEIPSEVKVSFINSGVMHILAVSGLHVGLITVMLVVVLAAVRIPEAPRIMLVCLMLFVYIFLTGSSPSVVRAVIMASVLLGAKLIERKSDIVNSLAVAAVIILLWDARQLFMPGFQLSFAAVLSIILLYPVFYSWMRKLPEWFISSPVANAVVRLFCLSLAAGLGTLPFTALYFGKIPVIGFLANIVVVPLSGVVLALAMTTTVFSFVWGVVASLYAEVTKFVTAFLLGSVKLFGGFAFSFLDARFSFLDTIGYYAGLAIMANIGRWRMKKLLIVVLLLGNVILYGWIFGFIGKESVLRVTFLDVGQGDAIFVEFPRGETMLIDAGPRGLHADAGARFVVPFLKYKRVSRIDAVVLSHPHSDHMGGVPTVLRSVPVSRVIDAGSYARSFIFDEFLRLVDSVSAQRQIVRGGDRIDGYSGVRVYVVHPTGVFAEVDSSGRLNLNNQTVVLRIVYGSTSILLVGDAEEDAEETLIRRYGNFLDSDVLKVGHHGSRTSSTEEFLSAVRPEIAVMSVGKNNKFRHPSPVVLARFARNKIKTYRTDEYNAVVLVSDGEQWWEERWR